MEHMLLVALTALYTDEREMDVRLGVLRVAINVLQRHGAPCPPCYRVVSLPRFPVVTEIGCEICNNALLAVCHPSEPSNWMSAANLVLLRTLSSLRPPP